MPLHQLRRLRSHGSPSGLTLKQLLSQTSGPLQSGGFVGFCRALPELFRKHLPSGFDVPSFRKRTQRAAAPLQSASDLLCYNAFYAARHYAVFCHLLNHVQQFSRRAPRQPVRLNVIDYGCGQGLASLALLEHLRQRPVEIDLHLVELSGLALSAASHYIRIAATNVHGDISIHGHNCSLDALDDRVFQACPQRATVHLFSNVLDMARGPYFETSRLLDQINRMPGNHVFLAASPTYWSGVYGFNLLKQYFPAARFWQDSCVTLTMPANCNVVSMRDGGVSTYPKATSRMLAMQCNTRRINRSLQ